MSESSTVPPRCSMGTLSPWATQGTVMRTATPIPAATLATGTPGVLQGSYTMILQDGDGQVRETHSISAGLDYSGVGPEHALLQATGRVEYISASDDEALEALEELCETEGILTALETSHAYAAARKWAARNPGKRILIGNSGRGDKDMPTLTKYPAKIRNYAAA